MRTPSQTVGPFFSIGMKWLAADAHEGLDLSGQVLDGAGAGVPDAVLELWSPGWFARCLTGEDGSYHCRIPEPSPSHNGQAPHLEVTVFARGLLQHLATRVYFPGQTAANDADPLLSSLDADRRATLIALPVGGGLRFDVRLQGQGETVFLAW